MRSNLPVILALAQVASSQAPGACVGNDDSCALCLAASIYENMGVNGSHPHRPLYRESFVATAKSKGSQQN